jgi:hypothetical protein
MVVMKKPGSGSILTLKAGSESVFGIRIGSRTIKMVSKKGKKSVISR